MEHATKIRALNDAFRKDPIRREGELVVTSGIVNLGQEAFAEIMCLVQDFDAFTPDNDPYGEHDFGSFTYDMHLINWKFDYYSDKQKEWGSEAPYDPAKCYRVLTVMLAREY